ncbi:MAG: SdiA-regulated domain-containing protein [Calditrichaceae bacterium]|nr:SdiA-regulated domain-containing protein [Calditrichaceae bacterium]MBN2707771.1 SdiA-regulated domain-containing protein [Calditrichaceae bacterium]
MDNNIHQLLLMNSYDLDIPEPSGLSLGSSGQCLWIVSDPPDNRVYKTNLIGDIITVLDFQGKDLEGVWFDKISGRLWLVEENDRELVELDTLGQFINRYEISGSWSDENGFEGICRDSYNNFWIANEKEPVLIIRLDMNFGVKAQYTPPMAEDVSGLFCPEGQDTLWVLSDESRLLLKWHPDYGVLNYFELDVPKPEGVAIDYRNEIIYMVSDSKNKLYKLRFPLD